MFISFLPKKYQRLGKFLVSGGLAAVIDIGLFYLLENQFGVWYIFASTVSFVAAVTFNFYAQKSWTFEERNFSRVYKQGLKFLFVSLANLSINSILLYVFVDFLHGLPLLGKIISNGLVACESFFVYRYFVFKLPLSNNEKINH